MPNPSFPSTIPGPIDEGMAYAPLVEPVLSTSMETGAPKRRRRFTNVPEKFTCTLVLNKAQLAALNTFVVTTLQDVLPFDWKDFRDGSAATYVFQKRPGYNLTAVGANLWKVPLDLMKVP